MTFKEELEDTESLYFFFSTAVCCYMARSLLSSLQPSTTWSVQTILVRNLDFFVQVFER